MPVAAASRIVVPGSSTVIARLVMVVSSSIDLFTATASARQSGTRSIAQATASASVHPLRRALSYASSRWAASSALISRRRCSSTRTDARWRCTSADQSSTTEPSNAAECVEEHIPFPARRAELPDALGRQAVTAAADARGRGLPGGLRPAPLLHAVEQGIQRGERKPQGAVALLFDTAGNLVAVQRLLFKHGQDRQLRTASLDRRVHRYHRDPIYSVPIHTSSRWGSRAQHGKVRIAPVRLACVTPRKKRAVSEVSRIRIEPL